jgi:RHS repeat-associated protein
LGRISKAKLSVANVSKLDFEYTYNSAGRLVNVRETLGTGANAVRNLAYQYNADGELLNAAEGGFASEVYTYDLNSNRTSKKMGAAPALKATFDASDKILNHGASGGILNYEFDADGFLSRRSFVSTGNSSSTPAQTDTFTYSPKGELLTAQVGTGSLFSYMYDAGGRQVGRVQGSNTLQLYYGNPNSPYQLTASALNNTLTYYFYNTFGNLIGIERSGQRYSVMTDLVGSPRIIVNSAGTITKQIKYSTFGEILTETNPAFQIPIGYAGGIYDNVTKLTRFGFRDYDAAAGRWTARDPILFEGGQGNLYVYVGNGPLIKRDPDGLDAEVIIWEPIIWPVTSSGGHVSAVVNGTSYSYESSGWQVKPFPEYRADQQQKVKRAGKGYTIKMTPAQTQEFENSLKRDKKRNPKYNLITNNCGDAVRKALNDAGVFVPDGLTPSQYGDAYENNYWVLKTTSYPK